MDGSVDTLTILAFQGLSYPNYVITKNFVLKTVRKSIRLAHACLQAYDRGLDIVAADEWLKQQRSHRGCRGQMDAALGKLYFPCGKVAAEEEIEADNIEDYGNVIEAMLMLGVHSEIAADEETVEASAEYIYGEEDDEEEHDEMDDGETGLNETFDSI